MDKTSSSTADVAGRSQSEEARLRQIAAIKPHIPLLEREHVLGYLLLAPALILIVIFMAYPFGLGLWFSVTDKLVGSPGQFVGLKNYLKNFHSQIFWQTAWNTFFFTAMATIFKTSLGMWLALIMNRKFRLSRFARAAVLLPFIVPTVLSTLAWLWMFDATFSVFNWIINWFWKLDISFFDIVIKAPFRGRVRINWLGDPALAMFSIILVNIWRGTPFFAISFLAGLQTVPPDMYDAGAIDGANGWQRFWNITLPMIKPIVVVVVVFSIVVTFADFQLVYVLTRGGPHNSTHLFATLAFQVAMMSGNLGEGAAVALFMLPFLAVLILWQLLYLRKEEGA
jgi:multiple sugar transport system permease protein